MVKFKPPITDRRPRFALVGWGGLRPGEKLYEEPLAEEENLLPTPHPKIKIARARPENGDWLLQLESRLAAWQPQDEAGTKAELRKWVQEYSPQS